jgi:sugar O-acyltransferase (sialic acid O-acetyltransferase NeuD family)
MSTLLVLGAGGHGRVTADAALEMNSWERVCFIDDRAATNALGLEVVGTLAQLAGLKGEFSAAAVGIGDAGTRLQMLQRCAQLGFDLPVIVHPSAVVSRFASLGRGTVILAQAAVNAGAVIGEGGIVNTAATVDHDCVLGVGVHVCPGAHLAGDVHIGDRTWIGIGACIRQGVKIGQDTTIGAGAVVVGNFESGLVITGVPGRARAKDP